MKDFITEAWLRANHTLSEGAEIHLPADSRLTPSRSEEHTAQDFSGVDRMTSFRHHKQHCCASGRYRTDQDSLRLQKEETDKQQ